MLDAERLAAARRITQEWIDQHGHERCWYYPDLFERIAECLEVVPTVGPGLPPRAEFEAGCRRYQDEQYSGQPCAGQDDVVSKAAEASLPGS